MLARNIDNPLQLFMSKDRPRWVLGVADSEISSLNNGTGTAHGSKTCTYFKMIIFVFDFTEAFSSFRSILHPLLSSDRHKLTSAPKDCGTEYSC